MNEKKSFQVVMNPKVQKRLKQRSQAMGITIGAMVENLLSSLEFRLEACAKMLEKKVHELSDKHIYTLTHAILLDDSRGGGTEKMIEAVKLVRKELIEAQEEALDWLPDIKLTGDALKE